MVGLKETVEKIEESKRREEEKVRYIKMDMSLKETLLEPSYYYSVFGAMTSTTSKHKTLPHERERERERDALMLRVIGS